MSRTSFSRRSSRSGFQGLGFRLQALGFRIEALDFRLQASGFAEAACIKLDFIFLPQFSRRCSRSATQEYEIE